MARTLTFRRILSQLLFQFHSYSLNCERQEQFHIRAETISHIKYHSKPEIVLTEVLYNNYDSNCIMLKVLKP